MPPYIATILIAIASCLAFVAYNHHDAFKPISNFIKLMTAIFCVTLLLLDAGHRRGVSDGYSSFYELNKDSFIKTPSFPEPDKPLPFLEFIPPLALLFYLLILDFLPYLGIIAKTTEKKKE